jgi:hypothetical protein
MDWTCGSSSTVPAGNPEFNNPAQTYKKKKKKRGCNSNHKGIFR